MLFCCKEPTQTHAPHPSAHLFHPLIYQSLHTPIRLTHLLAHPLPHQSCCDKFSNSNGQSIYKLAPHAEWGHWGFPVNASDGFVGHPKLHELNVGGLFTQIWFPCMTSDPIEIITVSIGPETGYGVGSHDTNFLVSEFDILVPEKSLH